MKLNRFLPLFIPLAVFLFLELFYFKPEMIYVAIVFIVLLFLFALRQFIRVSERETGVWNFIILPFSFTIGLIIFSVMVPSRAVVQILFFLDLFFLYIYFKHVYYYLAKSSFYKKFALENISAYGNFLVVFLFFSSIYGLQSFLNISVWILMIIVVIVSAVVVYQVIWINKIDMRQGSFYVILACLVLVETAWALSFLPLSFYLLGLILAICYYMLIGIIRFHLIGNLNRRLVKLYLASGFAAILLVLLTARWL